MAEPAAISSGEGGSLVRAVGWLRSADGVLRRSSGVHFELHLARVHGSASAWRLGGIHRAERSSADFHVLRRLKVLLHYRSLPDNRTTQGARRSCLADERPSIHGPRQVALGPRSPDRGAERVVELDRFLEVADCIAFATEQAGQTA